MSTLKRDKETPIINIHKLQRRTKQKVIKTKRDSRKNTQTKEVR